MQAQIRRKKDCQIGTQINIISLSFPSLLINTTTNCFPAITQSASISQLALLTATYSNRPKKPKFPAASLQVQFRLTLYQFMIFRFLIYSSLLLLISPMSVIARYPHDKKCYTQGFQFINETTLVESCGLYALSRVKFLDADKLNDILVRNMHQKVFGEGVTKFKGLIYVLTWREHQVYVYSEKLELQKVIRWDKQGWGLTHNETHMFVTDGTSNIYIVQESFKVVHMITVTHNNNPVIYLNELEYYKGNLLANIYMKHIIVEIDINTGQVIKQYDLKEIVQEQNRLQALRSDFVLNGIAYLNTTDKLLVTGKMWSQVYEIKL